jgi:peptide/nickel transport system substrate-binding protein
MKQKAVKIISLALVVVMMLGALGVVSAQDEQLLTILYWQAVSIVNPYLSGGTKDIDASALVLEPLASIDPDGIFVPRLATEIPTLENGGIVHTDSSTTITWNLRDDIVWSDGSPLTAADVVFTWQYCTHPEAGCSGLLAFKDVTNVEAVDDHTVTITFGIFKPYPYSPFVSSSAPIIQQAQFADCLGTAAPSCTDQNFGPIGTGPFMVEEMLPNDVVTYVRNPNYREEGKPFFDRVIFKGGGDAESAARAALETGESDYSWNLQVAADVLEEMETSGGIGTVEVAFGSSLERIQINFTNPDPALGENRSLYMDGTNPHPFLSDMVVRQALSMAIDRNAIAEQLYGETGRATCNMINGPLAVVSPNNDSCLTQDIDGANALLDEAGIVDSDGDGIREYNGVPLRILYQTSTNALRQNTQAIVKQGWDQIGVETELKNVDAAVFFGGDPASPDTYQKFFADVEMFTSSTGSLDPETFLNRWTCELIPGPDNGWLGSNVPRYCSEEYDALYSELTQTGDPAQRVELIIALNDNIVQNYAELPLVFRGSVSARANTLEGVWLNGSWDSEMWNIADWTRAS